MDLRLVTDDGIELAGTVDLPERGTRFPCVVALHAAAFGVRGHPLYEHLGRTLGGVGVGVCVYDRRGEGGSGGQPGATLTRLAADAGCVVAALRELPAVDDDRVGVWGVSQGGWIGPITAATDDRIAFVIAVSASGVSPSEQMRFAMGNVLRERGFGEPDVARALDARARIETAYRAGDVANAREVIGSVQGEAWFPFAYLPTVEDVEHPEPFEIDLDVGELFARIRVPTLAIYGSWDRWVPVDRSVDAWRSAFAGRGDLLRVARVPDAGHMMTTPIDREDLNEEGPISPTYAEAMTRWLPDALV